jgi:hypothetical protein
MVFGCKRCGARYRIDEALFEGKLLRFTCRKCGQVHVLRDPKLGGDPVTAVDGEPSQSGPLPRPQTVDAHSHSGPLPRPTRSDVTVPHGAGPTRPTLADSGHGPVVRPTTSTQSLPSVPAPAPAARDDNWFAIRKGARLGPFDLAGLMQQLQDEAIHDRSFVWRPTMASWVRMNQVPELAGLLTEYRDWLAARMEHTVISGHVLPPLPMPSDDGPPPPPAAGPAAPASSADDELFRAISQPSIDMGGTYGAPAGESVAGPSRGRPGEHDDLFFPAGEPEPAQEKRRYFTRATVMPQGDWPAGHADADGIGKITVHDKPAAAPFFPQGQAAAPGTGLAMGEFSVMVRVGMDSRKRRQRAFIAIIATSVVAVLAVVLPVYLKDVPPPPPKPIESESEFANEKAYREWQAKAEAERRAAEQRVDVDFRWPVKTKADGTHVAGTPGTNGNGTSLTDAPPAPGLEPLKPGSIEDATKADAKRYASLLNTGSEERDEAAVDFKPKTITEAPQKIVSKAGMDAFMASKMRRFTECKAKMSNASGVPQKIGLSFHIGADGKVGDIVVDQQGRRDEAVDSCIRRIVAGWAFPATDEPTTFKTTLLL